MQCQLPGHDIRRATILKSLRNRGTNTGSVFFNYNKNIVTHVDLYQFKIIVH